MTTVAEPQWVNVHVGFEGDDFAIDGMPVWKHEWHEIGEKIMLENRPDDSGLSSFSVYEIRVDGKTIRFAATEVLMYVFSFYQFMVKPDRFRDLKKSVEIATYLVQKSRTI